MFFHLILLTDSEVLQFLVHKKLVYNCKKLHKKLQKRNCMRNLCMILHKLKSQFFLTLLFAPSK